MVMPATTSTNNHQYAPEIKNIAIQGRITVFDWKQNKWKKNMETTWCHLDDVSWNLRPIFLCVKCRTRPFSASSSL